MQGMRPVKEQGVVCSVVFDIGKFCHPAPFFFPDYYHAAVVRTQWYGVHGHKNR